MNSDQAQTFTCPDCGSPTRHPEDVENRYCGACHWWTGDPELAPHRPATSGTALGRYLGKVRAMILEYGWIVQPGDGPRPFAYTVGLTAAGLPELVVVGLPTLTAQQILNHAASHHLRRELGKGATLVNVHAGVAFKVDVVDQADARRRLSAAVALYGARVSARQLLWPSNDGAFPGEPAWPHGDAQELGE